MDKMDKIPVTFKVNQTIIANDYNRVVIGARGAYIEFEAKHFVHELEVQPGQEWRGVGKYEACKYYWLRPVGILGVKIYAQRGLVNYADYKIGKFYISTDELEFEGELYAEAGNKPGEGIPTTWRKS